MRTDQKLKEICDGLRMRHGDKFKACQAAGLSVDFVENWERDDPEAHKAITEAQRVGWMAIESVLIDRAINGTEKQVFYKGQVVGFETEYHNALLLRVAEARVPAYKKGEGGAGGVRVNVQVNNMPRAANYNEWLEMRTRTLSDRADEAKQLAAPVPQIIQGDYVVKETRITALEGLL